MLDRLVGYMVSPALSDATGQAFSAGRVQSPATRLVVERERAIQIFKPTSHYGASVDFGHWNAEWVTEGYTEGDTEYVMDETVAEEAAACRDFVVAESGIKPARKSPPAPFRSATLMQAASIALGFDPERTMELAQQLFAQGHINYHRTDKQNFDDSSIEEIRAYALGQGWPLPPQARKWPSIEGSQEGHEAIRPLHLEVLDAGASDDEVKLYQLIWKRAIASQLADAEYSVNSTKLSCERGEKRFCFTAKGRQLVTPGWLALTDKDEAEEGEGDVTEYANGRVPVLVAGSSIVANSGKILNKSTQAPSRYTKASLIAKLEKIKIGRPSTYPAILKNIESRAYIKEDTKRKLWATQYGMMLVIALVKNNFGFIRFDFTAKLEWDLDKIASGQSDYKSVVRDIHQQIQKEIVVMQGNAPPAHPCPKCGAALRRLPSKDKGSYFWGCSKFRETECRGALDDNNGKPVAVAKKKEVKRS